MGFAQRSPYEVKDLCISGKTPSPRTVELEIVLSMAASLREAATPLRMTPGDIFLSHLSVFAGGGYHCQGLLQVGDQVGGVFNSYRQTN